MKVVSSRPLKSGKVRVTVDLDPSEELTAIHEDKYYRLNYPVDDVVQGHHLQGAAQVSWCVIEQKWI